MSKLQLTGQNLGRIFNSGSGCVYVVHLRYFEVKQANFKLKTRHKQLLGTLLLDIKLPSFITFTPGLGLSCFRIVSILLSDKEGKEMV